MDEQTRLEALKSYAILDTPPEADFDRLASLASFICQTPMAAITLIDDKRQWFKAAWGLTLTETDRAIAFCAHTITTRKPLIVGNALLDPRFADNPLVTGNPYLRFYAGIPLISPDGHPLGTLSVMDIQPRELGQIQLDHLATLAQQVMVKLELRRQELIFEQLTLGRVNSVFAAAAVGIAIARSDGRILLANPALCRMLDYAEAELCELSFQRITHPDDLAASQNLLRELLTGQRENFTFEKRYLKKNGDVIWVHISAASTVSLENFPTGVFTVVEDITQRKALEDQLQLNQNLLSMAGQMARLGGWRADLPLDRVIWSDEVCAIHEMPAGTSLRIDEIMQFCMPEWRAMISQRLEACVELGFPFDEEMQIVTARGNPIWVRAMGHAVRDTSGKVIRVQGAFQDITERKALESILTQRHQHFSEFANAMPVVVWTAGAEGELDYANKLFSDYSGFSLQDLILGKRWARTIHRDDIESALRIWSESVTSGRMYLTEFRILRHDGVYRWHLVRAVPIRAEDNRIIKWYGTAIDIHDRNVSEGNAQRLAERLATILDSITDAFITLDRDWRFTYVNSEAERLLNRHREDLKGKEIWQEFPETIDSDFEHYYRLAVTEGQRVSFEAYYKPLNGWFSVNAYPSSEGLAVYFQNINSRRQVQEQLRLLETCVAHMNDIVIITEAEPQDEPGPRILFVNEAFVSRTGFSREEVIGKSPRFLQGPKTQRGELDRIGATMKQWQPVRAELINYTKNGEEFWLDLDLVPIANSAGWFTHWVAVERDISERKQAEVEREKFVELQQAQKLAELASQTKSHFLATMSHEIRTPISGVIGMVEVLHQTSLKGYQVEMVDIIRESAMSLLGIIDDILDFSKIEAGKLDIESAPINLFDIVKNVCTMLDRFAENKKVELTYFCDPRLPETVLGDDLRLRQVLLNLVNNAIKFSSGPNRLGKVNLRVSLVEQTDQSLSLIFQVIDNGIGMSDETLARLFSPFVQADASTTRHFGGTGLGLTISRHLVELMGGEMSVESELGRGAKFCVKLSLQCPPGAWQERPILPDISGLDCVVLGEAERLGDDIVCYLRAAGLNVTRICDLALMLKAIQTETEDYRIWILDAVNPEAWLAGVPASIRAGLRCVVFDRGLRRKPRLTEKHRVNVDGNLLDRYTLFKSIAIVAGREQEDIWHHESGKAETAFYAPPRELGLQQKRLILVAEDNETNQKVITRQLALLGYAADVVANGREALKCWETGDYALLLTDLHMPEMDGYELVTRIRTAENGHGYLPIIALSANALRGEGERCRELGMDDYLTKPASLAELQSAIDRWLPREVTKVPVAAKRSNAPNLVSAPAALDLNILKELVGDEDAVVAEFLLAFGEDARLLAEQLEAALVGEDLVQVAAFAHKLKSSARSVGALVLGDLCAELEDAAHHNKTEALSLLLLNFKRELARVNTFLNLH